MLKQESELFKLWLGRPTHANLVMVRMEDLIPYLKTSEYHTSKSTWSGLKFNTHSASESPSFLQKETSCDTICQFCRLWFKRSLTGSSKHETKSAEQSKGLNLKETMSYPAYKVWQLHIAHESPNVICHISQTDPGWCEAKGRAAKRPFSRMKGEPQPLTAPLQKMIACLRQLMR